MRASRNSGLSFNLTTKGKRSMKNSAQQLEMKLPGIVQPRRRVEPEKAHRWFMLMHAAAEQLIDDSTAIQLGMSSINDVERYIERLAWGNSH